MKGLKIAFLTASSHVVKLLVSLFILKQISIIHGPAGLGLFGNFMSMVSIASSVAGGGIVSGVIKYLAEYSDSAEKQQRFVGSALLYTLCFSGCTAVLGILFIGPITGYIFPNQDYRPYIYLFFLSQCIVSLCNFSFGVANGLGKNHVYVMFLLVGHLIALVVAYFGITYYGVWGAVVAIMAPVVFPIVPAIFYALKQRLFQTLRFDSFFQDSRLLSQFSLMLLVSTLCFPMVEMVVRNHLISVLGLQSAGFWQAITKLSSAYLSFFSLFLMFYFVPMISAAREKQRIVKEVSKMIVTIGTAFLAMMLVYFIFQGVIIRTALSEQFQPVSGLMLLQMLGDFFRVLGWVVGFVVVAKAATTLYIVGELFQGLVFVIFSHVMLSHFHELRGVIFAYVATCFLYCMLSIGLFFYFFRTKSAKVKGPILDESNGSRVLL